MNMEFGWWLLVTTLVRAIFFVEMVRIAGPLSDEENFLEAILSKQTENQFCF